VKKENQRNSISSSFGFSNLKGKNRTKILAATGIIIVGLISASMLNLVILSDLYAKQLSSFFGIMIFGVVAAVLFGAGYYLLSRFVKNVDRNVMSNHAGRYASFFHSLYKIIQLFYFVNIAVFTIYFLQMVMTSQYSIGLGLGSWTGMSIFTATIFSVMAYKFFSWYRSRRDIAILLYGLSFAVVVFNIGFHASTNVSILSTTPGRIEIPLPMEMQYQSDANLKSSASQTGFFLGLIPGRIALFLYWLGTVVLLRNYSKQIGRAKFWTLAILPLAAMLIGAVFIFGGFGSSTVLFRATISGAAFYAASILFAMLFLTVARNASKSNHKTVAHHLTVCAIGVVVFLVAGAGSASHLIDWIHVPYPPFFFFFTYFLSLGALLYSMGFYFATIAISKDVGVRKSLKQFASRGSKLFGNLGIADMEQELQKNVTRIAREHEESLQVQTGIRQQSIEEEEMKCYLEEAINEVNRMKSGK
jgi:hypothetical protein